MIDVIEHAFAGAQTDDVADGCHEVFLRHRAHVERKGDAELDVDLVTSDTREVILFRVEKETLQQGAGVRDGRRIARAEATVDVLQRLFLVVRGILLQRLDDAVVLRNVHDFHVLDPERDDLADGRLRERLKCAGQRDLAVLDVGGEHLRHERLVFEVFVQLQVLDLVEELEDVLVAAVAERAEEGRRQNFPPALAAVEVRVEQIVRVVLEFHPRPAIGDDAEAEEHLAVQMDRALEADAWRTVQLRDHDAFRAVHDERAGGRHQRDFAHVNLLLLHALFLLEVEGHVERRGVSLALAHALADAHLRLRQLVAREVQRDLLVVARDREHLAEHRLQSGLLALRGRDALLQEFLVGIGLQLDEIWRLCAFLDGSEVDAFRHDVWCGVWMIHLGTPNPGVGVRLPGLG